VVPASAVAVAPRGAAGEAAVGGLAREPGSKAQDMAFLAPGRPGAPTDVLEGEN
jgi:hypothetical protein